MGKFTTGAWGVKDALHAGGDGSEQMKSLESLTNVTGKQISWHEQFWTGSTTQHTSGSIVVKGYGPDDFFVVSGESVKIGTTTQHAEETLIKKLKVVTKEYSRLPMNCKIIFCCHFSPCTQCLGGVVKTFLNDVIPGGANRQISFVFHKSYDKETLSGTKYNSYQSRHDTLDDALFAYREVEKAVEKKYGSITLFGTKKSRVAFRWYTQTKGGNANFRPTSLAS